MPSYCRPPGPRSFSASLALAFLLLAGAAFAQGPNVSMSAEPSLGGYYKPNRWLPIHVWLDNQGQPADVEVSAELKDFQGQGPEYRLEIEQLPAPARRRYTLYM